MKKPRILVDCHVFDHGFQGTRTYIEGIYSHWTKNTDFTFYLASENPQNLQSIFGNQEHIVYLTYRSTNRFSRLLFEIPKLIKQHQIDYTHFQYIVSPFKKGKYIVTTHDVLFLDFPAYFPWLNRIKNKWLYYYSAKMADIRLTVSGYSKDKIAEHFNLDGFYITPNAVKPVFFLPFDREKAKAAIKDRFGVSDYIIYISRWEPRKNHDLILKAYLDLKLFDKHQLVFVGDTTFQNPTYNALYESLDPAVKNKILRIEKTDFDTMIALLRGADVSVYPTIAEGFGIPPLEAAAAQIPTLCSDKTAMSDFDFFGDLLFDPYDEMAFKDKLSALLHQDNSAKMAGIAHKISEKYNWENSARVLQNAVEKDFNQ